MHLPNPVSTFRRLRESAAADNYFYAKLLVASTVSVLVILMLAGAILFVTIQDHRLDKLQARTLDVLRLSNHVESELAILETSHRGFLLTADPAYIKRLETAQHRLGAKLDELAV